MRRSPKEGGREFFYRGDGSCGSHLHRSVREVSDGAAQPEPPGFPNRPPAESHSLDPAADADVDAIGWYLVQRWHLLIFAAGAGGSTWNAG